MNSDEKTRLTVDIYGVQYKMAANTSPSYMKQVAELVDEQMRKIAKTNPRLDVPRIAVLAAVHMADENFKSYDENEQLKYKMQQLEQQGVELERLKQAHERLKVLHQSELAKKCSSWPNGRTSRSRSL